ncbi:MAG: hypothetical protein IPM46_06590 [Flavobacteriales bacterium]|nr:hypothetical protein [Flavobacteriales bacterium]
MWPVQTLTLLLCLTEDEQLYAQRLQQDAQPAAVEIEATEAVPPASAFQLILDNEA